jgi:hypothetical protein
MVYILQEALQVCTRVRACVRACVCLLHYPVLDCASLEDGLFLLFIMVYFCCLL